VLNPGGRARLAPKRPVKKKDQGKNNYKAYILLEKSWGSRIHIN
jgi:hypothetical protein